MLEKSAQHLVRLVAISLGVSAGCSAQGVQLTPKETLLEQVWADADPLRTLKDVHLGMELLQLRAIRPQVFEVPYTGMAETIRSDTVFYYFKPVPLDETPKSLLSRPRYAERSPLLAVGLQEWITEGDSSARARWKQRIEQIVRRLGPPQRCRAAPASEYPTFTAEWEASEASVVIILHPAHNATPLAPQVTVIPAVVRTHYGSDLPKVYPILAILEPTPCS